MLFKVCGITERSDIEALSRMADFLGFIFYEASPRNAFSLNPEIIRNIGLSVKTVGVFVDADPDLANRICKERNIQIIQLHGHESPEYISRMKEKGYYVIKAFRINEETDENKLLEMTAPYESHADMFLFDTGGKYAGGNGRKFNWEILKAYDHPTPYLLSGGISAEDWERVKGLNKKDYPGLEGIDLNSRFETAPGIKDCGRVETFIENIRSCEK